MLAMLRFVLGMWRNDSPQSDPDVQANARLTGLTGLLLLVMLFAEGVTIPFIPRSLLSWHIAIGLALIPPVALKLGSTGWRFARYYLRDPRYRRAGPPHPILRVLGPVIVVTTVTLFASGVAAWLARPPAHLFVIVHIASFIIWVLAMTVHVLAHALRAARLAWADRTRRRGGQVVPYRRRRLILVVASLAAGVALGLVTRGLVSAWPVWVHARYLR